MPLTVAPAAGVTMETAGGARSPARVRSEKSPETARFPAKSRDRTRKWYRVLATSPPRAAACDETRVGSSVVRLPYAAVSPYSICESLGSFVVQLTAAPKRLMAEVATAVMTGGVTSGEREYVMRREGRSAGSACSMLAK